MNSDYSKFAIALAKEAGKIINANFVLGMKKEWKEDDTPLTQTDLAVNVLVLDSVKKRFPAHDVISEEGSNVTGTSEFIWVCDPIDGTVPFSHGYPTFTFSLALTKNGESIVGVIYDPILERLVVAEKGKGAFLNGERISVSKAQSFNNVIVNLDGDYNLAGLRELLVKEGTYVSTLYCCTYAGLLVAVGEFVGEVFEYKNPWDGAAIKIIVEEAGGKVTDMEGNEQRYDKRMNGFVASNGIMHNRLLELIKLVKPTGINPRGT